jgi:uncharacterized protein (DUF1499 family)
MRPLIEPCPSTPNCVATTATDRQHAIAPIGYGGSAAEAMRRLLAVLRAMPRTTIVSADETTVRAEFRTRLLRFVDDGVFVIDEPSGTIQFRSASRLGRKDFGVNRKRMEEIRAAFDAAR